LVAENIIGTKKAYALMRHAVVVALGKF
jgi:hypothetical protein